MFSVMKVLTKVNKCDNMRVCYGVSNLFFYIEGEETMGIFDSLFSTANGANSTNNSTETAKVKETPKVRGVKKGLPYVDVIDAESHIIFRVDTSGCDSTIVSFDTKPLASDHSVLVSDTIRFKRVAKKAKDGVKYISRGIVPEDTIDVLSVDPHQFYAVEDVRSVSTYDPDDSSIVVIELKKVKPTCMATF